MLSKVQGRFTGIDATVVIVDDPADSVDEATIDVSDVTPVVAAPADASQLGIHRWVAPI